MSWDQIVKGPYRHDIENVILSVMGGHQTVRSGKVVI